MPGNRTGLVCREPELLDKEFDKHPALFAPSGLFLGHLNFLDISISDDSLHLRLTGQ